LLQLVEHGLHVYHHSVAKHVLALGVEDAAGEEVEGVLGLVNNDGVAGVGASVESSADVVVLGQDVDELALALVAPLGTEDDAEARLEAVGAGGRELSFGDELGEHY